MTPVDNIKSELGKILLSPKELSCWYHSQHEETEIPSVSHPKQYLHSRARTWLISPYIPDLKCELKCLSVDNQQ